MIKTTGIFFDGISSIPQKIEITFEERFGQFTFDLPIYGSKTWTINNLTIDNQGTALNIKLNEFTIEYIKIEDPAFNSTLNHYLKLNGHVSWYQQIINLGFKLHIIIAIGIIGLIISTYIFVIPWIGEKSVFLIPQEYDDKLGNSFYNEYVEYNTIDSAKTAQLNLFAKQLILKNSKELKFTVIKSNTINAFALPDGNIIVFTGIINQMQSYEELVGLIGHEVIHINDRHSMKMLCRNLSGYLFLSAVLNDVNGIMAVIGDNIRNLQSLSFSRQFEKDADMKGFYLMTLNKTNPKGMINLFKKLESNHENMVPEFLSSHPVTKERLNYIDKMIKTESYQIIENQKLKVLFSSIKK